MPAYCPEATARENVPAFVRTHTRARAYKTADGRAEKAYGGSATRIGDVYTFSGGTGGADATDSPL